MNNKHERSSTWRLKISEQKVISKALEAYLKYSVQPEEDNEIAQDLLERFSSDIDKED